MTHDRFRPARPEPYESPAREAERRALGEGDAGPHRLARVLRERGKGGVPTIVLGGLVPDSTEQVFLLRHALLRSGSIYYVNYPRRGFSLNLICAQLDDLVADVAQRNGPPVMFGVSFGAGVILEWLRRARIEGRNPPVGGVVLVSPVACVDDLIAPGAAKPATLIGRALKPFVANDEVSEAAVEKSRAIFLRMFDAGAQNKAALRVLMRQPELEELQRRVASAIREIDHRGAQERVRALCEMRPPPGYFLPRLLPLTTAPTLVLFAENEEAVLLAGSPTRFALESAMRAYFPTGQCRRVCAQPGVAPVQHASLIFHVFEFLPAIAGFYQRVRPAAAKAAA